LKTLVNLCFNLIWSIEMNEQTKKVVQQALEALEDAVLDYSMGKGAVARHGEAITALRQLLEQPASQRSFSEPKRSENTAWVGLTTTERKEIERQSVYVEGAIRMTEAKLREKNGY
jgi:hypothetical protein